MAGLGAGTAPADEAPTDAQPSLDVQRLACPQAMRGCGARDLPVMGDLRTAVWTVVEGDMGPYPDPDRDRTYPGPRVTPVVAQMPYAVTGDVPESRQVGQLGPMDTNRPGRTAAPGEGEQPQGLPRAVLAALIALIGIVAVARRGMSRKD